MPRIEVREPTNRSEIRKAISENRNHNSQIQQRKTGTETQEKKKNLSPRNEQRPPKNDTRCQNPTRKPCQTAKTHKQPAKQPEANPAAQTQIRKNTYIRTKINIHNPRNKPQTVSPSRQPKPPAQTLYLGAGRVCCFRTSSRHRSRQFWPSAQVKVETLIWQLATKGN